MVGSHAPIHGNRRFPLEIFKPLLERLSFRQAYFVTLSVSATLFLFPEKWLITLGVSQLAKDHEAYIGLLFLGGAFCAIADVFGHIHSAYAKGEPSRKVIKRLNKLTEDEKAILRHYIAGQTTISVLRFDDSVAQGLAADKIIGMASVGRDGSTCSFIISQAAWDYLQKNSSILEGETVRVVNEGTLW